MKKNRLSLVHSCFISLFVLGSLLIIAQPVATYASSWWINDSNPICTNNDCGAGVGRDILKNKIEGKGLSTEADIIPLVLSWVRFFLGFVFVIAVIVLIVAGVMFITSFGNDAQNQKARKMILWTIIGILVIMLSYIIVSAIMGALTAA